MLDLQRIHEVDDITGQRRWLTVAQGVFGEELRIAITARIRHQHPITLGREQRRDFIVAVNVVGPTVQQDHHRAVCWAGFGIGDVKHASLHMLERAEG
ncbi:hypothetical protein D3C81_1831160 [compost metagenome]